MSQVTQTICVIVLALMGIGIILADIFLRVKGSDEVDDLEAQKQKVQEWLIWAVIRAEKELGGGTGQIKLRKVYEMFVIAFPWMVKLLDFTEFSIMVDIALERAKEMLKNNAKVKDYVESGSQSEVSDIIGMIKKITTDQ